MGLQEFVRSPLAIAVVTSNAGGSYAISGHGGTSAFAPISAGIIARRGTEHGSGLGTHRWVIEQAIALLHWFRRLRIRWEIRDDIHEAFLSLACAIICWRRLTNLSLC